MATAIYKKLPSSKFTWELQFRRPNSLSFIRKNNQLQSTVFLPPIRWCENEGLFSSFSGIFSISASHSSLLPPGSPSGPSFFTLQCNEGPPWRMQAPEARLCCQLSLMLCSMLMEEDVLNGFLSLTPEHWTGTPHRSGLRQQRVGSLWDPAAFCITLMICQTNGFGGASSRLILAQKNLKPATFLYSLVPVWDTLAGCVS